MQTQRVKMFDHSGHNPKTYWSQKMDTDWETIVKTTQENGGGFNIGDTVYAPDKDEIEYDNGSQNRQTKEVGISSKDWYKAVKGDIAQYFADKYDTDRGTILKLNKGRSFGWGEPIIVPA